VKFKEFGNKEKKTLVLIHGLGITWKMFTPFIQVLEKDYFLIIPILDGHDVEEDSVFETVEGAADEIIGYIKEKYGAQVFGIYGVSLGGTIASVILEKQELIFEKAIIDAGPIYPMNKFLLELSIKLRVKNVLSLKTEKSIYRKMLDKTFYPQNMIEVVCKLAKVIQKATLENAFRSAFSYQLKSIKFNGKIAYWYGTKEGFLCNKYAKHIQKICPQIVIKVFDKYDHGELAIGHPEKCIVEILDFISTDL
jgi:esterase/lipase